MVWTKTSDGSILDQNGKVIFFSTRRFIDDICSGNCCFMRSKARGKAVQRRACFPGMATPASRCASLAMTTMFRLLDSTG